MTQSPWLTPEDHQKGEEAPILGPAYFAARRTVQRFTEHCQSEMFAPLVNEFAKVFRDKLWRDIDAWLLSDTENNLQHSIWRGVDEIVGALLSGEPRYITERYALGSRYECDKIRAAVAKHIPGPLQNARIADLEKQVAQLKQSLEWSQR